MTMLRRGGTLAGGSNLLLWVGGAVAAFLILFWLITLALHLSIWPEAITKNADLFVGGARTTLYLTVVSGVIGIVIGVMLGLGKLSAFKLIAWPCSFLIWIIRGTPLYIQLLFANYALPELLPPFKALLAWADTWPALEVGSVFVAAVFALSLNVAAYNAEVIRGGVQGVPRGQAEAARSLGLSGYQTMLQIVLPQALRLSLPALVNNLVALLKDSSLAAVIAVTELARIAAQVASSSFEPVPTIVVAAGVYLALTSVLTLFTDQLERRVKVGTR
jgi:polar amino acid transport system permease protein